MNVVYYVVGGMLVVIGAADVFFTVLAYDSTGLLNERGYRAVWRATRVLADRLPTQPASVIRGVAAPVMVAGSIVIWLALQIVGFALLFYPSVASGVLTLHGASRSFWASLYFSAGTISSLAFSLAEPRHSGALLTLAVIEPLIGLAILTLAIAYVIGLYGVVQDAAVAWVSMQNHAGSTEDATDLLAVHFTGSANDSLSVFWRELHRNMTMYLEGMRRYPVVYYFHTRRARRSLPYMFSLIGEAASAVRWGLPSGDPAAKNPWLPGLLDGYRQGIMQIEERFLNGELPAPAPPVGFEEFHKLRDARVPSNGGVKDFIAVEDAMRTIAGVHGPADAHETYERYREWWRLMAPARAFVRAASIDFGTDLHLGGG